MIRFFNTLSGKIEPFEPQKQGLVKLYTCGPTVYDYPHIGNYRAYMFEDLLKRFLMYSGFDVEHVMNITDVDDKIIQRASQLGISLDNYTRKYIEAFHRDISTLNILPADHYPRATRYVDRMAAMVAKLVDKGYAYRKDGSYYFQIDRFADYGRLSKLDRSGRQAGVRIDSDEYEKESVHDFALWKAPKPGEHAWDTEIGPGRPGWHIECSVMSMELLGETLDIHCGGVDNIFPHHENEIAQSEALTGRTFVRYWLHCQHLIRDGQKMSKSKGNTISLGELISRHGAHPRAIRLMLLSTHYRKMLNFTMEGLAQAQSSLDRIRNLQAELGSRRFPPGANPLVGDLERDLKTKLVKGLQDDLNISSALTALFDFIKKVNSLIAREEMAADDVRRVKSALEDVDRVLGLMESIEVRVPADETDSSDGSSPDELGVLLQERETARQKRDFERADALRDRIREKGYIIEDTRDGPRLKKVEDRG